MDKVNQLTSYGHSKSIARMEEANAYSPGGVHSSIRKLQQDIVFSRTSGGYMWDIDGNRYIDYNAAFAAIILGHCDPDVNQEVFNALSEFDITGIGTNNYEIEVCKKIVTHVPGADLALLCNSGSEATYHAIRLSRAVTGRVKILKFQGGYHGWHDYVLMNVFTKPEKIGQKDPLSAGMLAEAVGNTTVVEFNDIEAVEKELKTGQYAAVILEPISHNIGCILPTPEFVKALRDLTLGTGTILIFDEVITGFRHGLGGYQSVVKVKPDLTTLGKAIANGYPCAAIAGRRDLMSQFATAGGPVYFAGTHNGHTMGTVAAIATIRKLEDGKVYQHLFELGDYLQKGLTAVADRLGIPMYVSNFGSIFTPYFIDPSFGPPRSFKDLQRNDMERDTAFRLGLLEQGIFTIPRPMRRICLVAAHTREDIDFTLNVAEDVLRNLR
jgi:glutamate-1-semialdehyde 2,1-aminomutase